MPANPLVLATVVTMGDDVAAWFLDGGRLDVLAVWVTAGAAALAGLLLVVAVTLAVRSL